MKRDRLALLMAAYALAYFALMRMPGDIVRSPIAGSDLSSYYTAGWMVRQGAADKLYETASGDTILGDATGGAWRQAGDAVGIARQHYYIYPPFFALMAAPLSLLPFGPARLAWLGMDLCLLAVFVVLYAWWRRVDGTPLEPIERVLIAVTIGLEFLPLIWALAIGQTSLMLLVLLAGAMLLLKSGRDAPAGILVGLAAAIKLTPGLLILYFALRGRARLAAWAAGCFVACNVAGAVALGPSLTWRFYVELAPMMAGGTAYFLNQSLVGFFDRLLTDGDVRQVAIETAMAPRMAATAASLVLLAVTAFALARAGTGAPGASGPATRPEGLALDLEVSAILLLTLMLAPISWSHHYVLALLPLYTLVGAAARSGRRNLLLGVALGAAFLLIARKPHFELFLDGAGRLALSAALYGALILWASCLCVRRWLQPAGPEARHAR